MNDDENEKISQVVVINNRGGEAGAHHSSGWKVALADIMCSLFASFFVLWLIASTDPAVKAEIASFFKHPSNVPKEFGAHDSKSAKQVNGTSASLIKRSGGRNQSKDKQKHKGKADAAKHKTLAEVMEELKKRIEASLGDNATITFVDNEILITIKGDTLYKPGQYQASPKDEEIIMDLADVLVDTDQIIRIEGHTDDTPTNSTVLETNYELSSVRAARIAWIFNIVGVEGKRIVPTGLGQNFPIAENFNAKGRSKNRRVEIRISDISVIDEATKKAIFN